MGSDWQDCALGDAITLKRGYDLPAKERRPGSVPIVSSSGISDVHSESMVKGPGVVTGRYGTIGQVFYVDSDFWPLNTTLYVQDFKGNDRRFVAYMLRTVDFHQFSDKAAVPGVNRNHLHTARILLPPVSEQVRVASVLQSFDDRINLLRQTNATLESIAQALFKSWFIDFDPVRAKAEGREPEGMDAATAALFPAEFEESALGLIPKGWRRGTVRDACEIFDAKRIPLSGKQRAAKKGPYPYYGAAALMDFVDEYLFDGVYLLLGEDGSVTNTDGTPITQYVWGKFWVNNHAHVLQGANGICTEHLMLALRGIDFTPYVTGAVQAKLNQGNLFRIPFLLPTAEVSLAFAAEVQALYERLRANSQQSKVLEALRDALLPRLISGKLRLPEAQEHVEDALA